MNRIIGVTELQRKFRTVFDDVVKHRKPYILTRGRRPEAVMMSYDQYLKFVEMNEDGVLRRFDQAVARMTAANARYADDEVEADVIAATRTVRRMARKRA